jgi:hypothetical protein
MAQMARRYARATQSNNLKSDEFHHDVDSLAAVAMSTELGSMLFRVKFANDATSYVKLAQTWEWEVKKRAALAGWPVHVKDETVAKTSLKHWLNDLCPACTGKGVQKKAFEETLSDDACEVCEGGGKRPIECADQIRGYVAEMVYALDEAALVAGNAAIAKLAEESDLD